MSFPSLDAYFTQSDQFSKIKKPRYGNTPEFNNPIWLDVEGEIPSWLRGVLYRIGPGKFILNEQEADSGKSIAITHAFDGLAYVHRFEFDGKNQKLRYNSRQTSKDFEKNIVEDRLGGHSSFGTFYNSNVSSWERFMDFLKRSGKRITNDLPPSSTSVNVTITPNYPLPNNIAFKKDGFSLVAKTDLPNLQKIHHDTLEPEKLFTYSDYDKRIVSGRFSASHHQQDKTTGEVFNFTISLGQQPQLTVFKINQSDNKVTILAEIKYQSDGITPFKPAYIHAFWMTQNYVIIPISPCYAKNHGLDMGITGVLLSGLEWDEKSPTYFYVVDRHGKGLVATIPVDPHFAFHTLHGRDYVDENGNVVLELNTQAFDDGNVLFEAGHFADIPRANQVAERNQENYLSEAATEKINGFHVGSKKSFTNNFGDLRRYTIQLKENQQHETNYTTLVKNIEFARIHPDYIFKTYRYVYYNSVMPGVADLRGLQYILKKVDLQTGQEITWTPETQDAYICSEPVYVPRPTATEEDDGVVISLVNLFDNRGKEHDRCYLLFLNAKDYTEYGRVHLGQFTATTFHGSYVDTEFQDGSFN
ncbi:unnamed protein product [Cunninghamella echinulata]